MIFIFHYPNSSFLEHAPDILPKSQKSHEQALPLILLVHGCHSSPHALTSSPQQKTPRHSIRQLQPAGEN